MKRWALALIGLVILGGLFFADPTAAARNSNNYLGKGLWWDGNDLLVSTLNAETTEIDTSECGEARYTSRSLGEVAVVGLRTKLFTDCLQKSNNADLPSNSKLTITEHRPSQSTYTSIPDEANYRITINNAPAHPDTVEYYCEDNNALDSNPDPDEWVISVTACWRLEVPSPQSWSLGYTGIKEQDGSMVFRSKTDGGRFFQIEGCSVKVLANVIQDSSGRYKLTQELETDWYDLDNDWCRSNDGKLDKLLGPDVKTERDIKGTPGISAAQSSTEAEFARQKTRLKNEYIDTQCNNTNNSLPSLQCGIEADKSFEVIWRACTPMSGNPAADTDAAYNCIKKHTGTELDKEAVLANVPPKPVATSVDDCQIDMLGYVICPMMRFMANAADSMFSTMQKLLVVSPLDRNEDGGAGAYKAWAVLRDIANVIFVIGLLAAVISQITGYGITNYGLKKFLPKLMVAAVLVNISFLICTLLVDISNIIGDSIHSLLLALNESLPSNGDVITANMGAGSSSIQWVALIGSGLIGGGIALAIVMMFVPILSAVLIALLIVVLLLLTRQALIIILTVIAPIAFVLSMLPNTKKWFSKWRSYYITLLMLYPLIAVVFGLSTIAANVILQIGTSTDSQTLQLFALAIQAVPLVITPIIVKLGGMALGNAAKLIRNNGLTKGIGGRSSGLQERLVKRRKLRALKGGRGPISALYRRQANRDATRSIRKGELSRAQAQHVSDYMQGVKGSGGDKTSLLEKAYSSVHNTEAKTKGEKYVDSIAAGGAEGATDRALGQALSISSNIETEEAKTAKAAMVNASEDDLAAILAQARSGDAAFAQSTVQAAAELATEKGDGDGAAIAGALATSPQLTPNGRESLLATVSRTSVGGLVANPTTAHAIRSGVVTEQNYPQTVIAPSFNEGTISAAQFGSLDETTMEQVIQARDNGHLSQEGEDHLRALAQEVHDNDKIQLESGQEAKISQLL